MLTKFHHYILPAVPPAAMLTGVLLDGLFDRSLHGEYARDDEGGARPGGPLEVVFYAAGFLAGMVGLIWGGSRIAAFLVAAPGPARSVPAVLLGAGVAVLGVAALVVTARVFDRVLADDAVDEDPPSQAAPREGAGTAYRGEADAPVRKRDPYRRRFEVLLLGAAGVAGVGHGARRRARPLHQHRGGLPARSG